LFNILRNDHILLIIGGIGQLIMYILK